MTTKSFIFKACGAAMFGLYAATASAVPSLQVGDADGGVCGDYDAFNQDCLIGDTFTLTSLLSGSAYVVFTAVPHTNVDTFTINPMIGGVSLAEVQSGYGAPPLEDSNSLAPHDVFDSYFEVYRLDFTTAGTVYNVQPGNEGDFADGYIETVELNLSLLLDGGIHVDLFRCTTGSVETGDCQITNGNDFAPFSHDGTYVPVPAAVWLFGSGLLGLVGVARRKD